MRGFRSGRRPSSLSTPLAWVLSPALLALGGCGSSPPATPEAKLQPPPMPPQAAATTKPPAAPAAAARPGASAGLTPLPTAQQVLAATPEGRTDPFAPVRFASSAPAARTASATRLPASAASEPTPMTLPEGFQFNGVISVSGTPQAIVQYGAESGSLFIGDRGGQGTPLLPRGWSVAAIDVQNGRLTLVSRQNTPRGQRITAQL